MLSNPRWLPVDPADSLEAKGGLRLSQFWAPQFLGADGVTLFGHLIAHRGQAQHAVRHLKVAGGKYPSAPKKGGWGTAIRICQLANFASTMAGVRSHIPLKWLPSTLLCPSAAPSYSVHSAVADSLTLGA